MIEGTLFIQEAIKWTRVYRSGLESTGGTHKLENNFLSSHIVKCRGYQIISHGRMKISGILNTMISHLIEKVLEPWVTQIWESVMQKYHLLFLILNLSLTICGRWSTGIDVWSGKVQSQLYYSDDVYFLNVRYKDIFQTLSYMYQAIWNTYSRALHVICNMPVLLFLVQKIPDFWNFLLSYLVKDKLSSRHINWL